MQYVSSFHKTMFAIWWRWPGLPGTWTQLQQSQHGDTSCGTIYFVLDVCVVAGIADESKKNFWRAQGGCRHPLRLAWHCPSAKQRPLWMPCRTTGPKCGTTQLVPFKKLNSMWETSLPCYKLLYLFFPSCSYWPKLLLHIFMLIELVVSMVFMPNISKQPLELHLSLWRVWWSTFFVSLCISTLLTWSEWSSSTRRATATIPNRGAPLPSSPCCGKRACM